MSWKLVALIGLSLVGLAGLLLFFELYHAEYRPEYLPTE
jgi:hypothetical protein